MSEQCKTVLSEMKLERNRNMPETDDKNEIYDAGYDEAIQNVCEDSYRRGYRDGYDEGRKIGHSECAAGPWQPMDTAPENGRIMILTKSGPLMCQWDAPNAWWGICGTRSKWGLYAHCLPPEYALEWARINT